MVMVMMTGESEGLAYKEENEKVTGQIMCVLVLLLPTRYAYGISAIES